MAIIGGAPFLPPQAQRSVGSSLPFPGSPCPVRLGSSVPPILPLGRHPAWVFPSQVAPHFLTSCPPIKLTYFASYLSSS